MDIKLKRGQLIRSYRTIAKDCAYKVGYRLKKPSIGTVHNTIKFLENTKRIRLEKISHETNTKKSRSPSRSEHLGYIITIINYNDLQPLKKNELNSGLNTPRTPPEHNKNDKELKELERKSTRKDAFSVPGQEEINEASIIKLKADIKMMAEKIYQDGIFKKIHAFANKAAKFSKNERAILHTLNRCYIRGRRQPFRDDKEAWAYCQKVIGIENGNYNERDHQKTSS